MELREFKNKVLPLKDRLYRIALHMLKSVEEVEDALQDVMVRLWDKRMQLGEYRNLEAFALTVTTLSVAIYSFDRNSNMSTKLNNC